MVNILIAEDDREDFLLLEEAIENTLPQFRITHIRDGKEFLSQVDVPTPPHLIFLDLNLPKKSGLDCLIAIRQKQTLQNIPVVIYSTSSDFEDINLCYKNGCTLYLVKPASFKELLAQVKKIFLHELTEEALLRSEERLQLFIQASSSRMFKMSADWTEMSVYDSLDHDPRVERLSRSWLQRQMPAEDWLQVSMAIRRAIEHKNILEIEHRVIGEGGETGWVFFRAVPLIDEYGTVSEWIAVASDITARKKAEEELRQEHYFLEQITDNTPHLIYVFDLEEQRFIYINRRIEELTGIAQDYVYGMGQHLFKMILHPEDLSRRVDYFSSLSNLAHGETRDDDFRLRSGNGYLWFRSKDRIFKTEGGRITQIIGLAEDVTYEKRLQQRLEQEIGFGGLN